MKKNKDEVRLLNMSLYGTRDAAANFQAEVTKECTFNKYNRGTFFHAGIDVSTVIVGRGNDETKDGKVLNPVIRAKHDGWCYEADE